MLALRIRQKDAAFYFVSYPAEDLLRRVRFISRFYADADRIPAQRLEPNDEVAAFIARIERTDEAFQRALSEQKVKAILNFYETTSQQPPIPGTILLFSPETLEFEPTAPFTDAGNLSEPRQPFLIIDGQHRLAALHFYLRRRAREDEPFHVPCVVFDGASENFAVEMFVVVNSTPTRINKSHLIDLYQRVSWISRERKVAAEICKMLYQEADSPLRYRINRLGGRSRQDKWILQAELFNELHRWLEHETRRTGSTRRQAEHDYSIVRDFLQAAREVWSSVGAWDDDRFMVCRPVVLRAMLRVCFDLADQDAEPAAGRVERWKRRLEPWRSLAPDMRADGFYNRFAAKGEVERVAKVHRQLATSAQIPVVARSRGRLARD